MKKLGRISNLLVLVSFVFVFFAVAQPASVKACPQESDFGQMLQGLLGDADGHGAVAAAGKFIFPLKWDSGDQEASVAFGSWAGASASVPDGLVKLYVRGTGCGTGKPFNWAAGGIYDTYNLASGTDPENINVAIQYDGELTGVSGFGLGLFGSEGFEVIGKFSPGTYNDEWSVPLTNIVGSADASDGSFLMGYGAFAFAMGSDSEAIFNDTFQLSFVDDQGNHVYIESDGGFSQVPIPSTIILLGVGLTGLLGFRQRKKR